MRKFAMLWVLVILAGLITGPGSAAAADKILIGMSNWIGYAPLYLAQEKGFFKAQGIDVEVKLVESLHDRRIALAAGRLQGICTTVDAHVITAANGVPVKQVLALDDSFGGDGIVAKKSIKTVQDLKGKTVAGHKGGATLFWINWILTKNGMTLNDIKMLDMKAGDAASAFVAGKVDAAITWQPHLSRAAKQADGHILMDSSQTPGVIVDSLGFNPAFIQSNPAAVKKIVHAWFQALAFHKANPKEANTIMAKFTGDKPEAFAGYLKDVRYYGPDVNKAYFGTADKPGDLYEILERAIDLWIETKQITKRIKPDEVIDASFIR